MNGGINAFRHDQTGYERPTLGWRCGPRGGMECAV